MVSDGCQESTMVVLSFDESVAETESEMKMHVEIAGQDRDTPIKAVVYWINSQTGYFMAPSSLLEHFHSILNLTAF